jgi:hypothetical protein
MLQIPEIPHCLALRIQYPRPFVMRTDFQNRRIGCACASGPGFRNLHINSDCNANSVSTGMTFFDGKGDCSVNDSQVNGETRFAVSAISPSTTSKPLIWPNVGERRLLRSRRAPVSLQPC